MADLLNGLNQPVALWQAIAAVLLLLVGIDFSRGIVRAARDSRQRRILPPRAK